LKIVEAINV